MKITINKPKIIPQTRKPKYKGPVVIDIEEHVRQLARVKFNHYVKTARNVIVITKDIDSVNRSFSTFSDADTVYMLEKIKAAYLK